MRTLNTLILCIGLGLALAGPVSAGPVNINTADAKTLAKELDGIGTARAKAIIAYREKNGPFKSAEDLRKVDGIGDSIIEKNRAKIVTDAKAPAAGG